MNSPVHKVTTDEWQVARRALESLISKSEKAQQKLAAGTWQHKMLGDNLKALRIASALMDRNVAETDRLATNDLRDARRALDSMAGKASKARASFAPGTSHHTLQQNRLKALRIAQALTQAHLAERET